MKIKQGQRPEGDSRYAKKQRLKFGNGTIDPRWMSWSENPKNPRRRAGSPQ